MIARTLATVAVALGLATGGLTPAAYSTPIIGSLNLSSDGVVDDGQDLLTRVVFAPDSLHVGLRTGNFMLIAGGTPISGGTLDLDNLDAFSFTIADGGTFTDAGFGNAVGTHTATNIDVYLLGVFTPVAGGVLAAFEASPASVRFGLTRTGALSDFSISFSGTAAAPPATPPTLIPEPVSFALLGGTLLGLGVLRRRA